jgi:hypothetical protein
MIDEAIDKLTVLLQGKIPDRIDAAEETDERTQKFAMLLNELFAYLEEIHEFILPLSKGELNNIKLPRPRNFLGSPFKELHSHLLHLTWQATQVAHGDYSQRIDFMGDFSKSFNDMITSLESNEKALKVKITQLEKALSHISKLEGILPICANCKKIRLEGSDPAGIENWIAIENYISRRTEARFSHGICPECARKLYAEFLD